MSHLAWETISSHWGVQDPALDDESESEKRQKFKLYFEEIKKHVTSFIKDLEDGSQPKELVFKIEKQFLFLASRVLRIFSFYQSVTTLCCFNEWSFRETGYFLS